MKLTYLTSARLPTARAHGTQIVKMCEAFAEAGVEVTLITPNKKNEYSEDLWTYYNVKKNFTFKRISSSDFLGKTLRFGRLLYWIDTLSFLISSYFNSSIGQGDHVYVRDPLLLLPFSRKRNILCAEIHDIPTNNKMFIKLLKRAHRVIALNDIVRDELVELGINQRAIISAVDGVDIEEFNVPVAERDARRQLNLPEDPRIVLYTGHLYRWKGAHILAEAARLLPPQVVCVFVGGVDTELREFEQAYRDVPNVRIVPFQKRDIIPVYLKAANVLVLPNTAKAAISAKYTSPLKLFEYMAAKRPIIASDLPSMRQVLSEANCFFVQPDNSAHLAETILTVLGDPSAAQTKMVQAFEDVKQYTWYNRGKRIINFIAYV